MERAVWSTEADEFLAAFGRRIRRLNYQTIRRLETPTTLSTAGLPALARALNVGLRELMPTDTDYADQTEQRRLVRYKFDWSPSARQRSRADQPMVTVLRPVPTADGSYRARRSADGPAWAGRRDER